MSEKIEDIKRISEELIQKSDTISFKTVREEWNEYKVKDSVPLLLRGKHIVVKFFDSGTYNKDGTPIYGVGSQDIFAAFAPKELRGTPTPGPIDNELINKSILKELEFESIKEDWNVYELDNGAEFRVKLVVTEIQKTSLFGQDSQPIYNITASPTGRFKFPPELIHK